MNFRSHTALLLLAAATSLPHPAHAAEPTLRGVFEKDFLVGVALSSGTITGRNPKAAELAATQFSAITPENETKWQSIHPQPDQYRFESADAYVSFAKEHKMELIGHTLVWHSQTPGWVFQGEDGKPPTREVLLKRMHDHIQTVVGRYKGKVKDWDVVNEALSDGGPELLRDSPWRKIIGDDFIDLAFRYAHEADPKAELYYNDYGLESERKRANSVKLLKGLLDRGVPITGVGTQSHFHLNQPPVADIEKTIKDFSALGLKVMVTELDVDVLPGRGNFGNADVNRREQGDATLNPYTAGLPEDMQKKLAERYAEIFDVYLRHRKAITRVTFWGLSDGQTWLNGFPIRGRTNYPLLFDRELKPKPAFEALIKKGSEKRTP
ncbi:endo-1,4-beta-xylanase [Haloferula sp. BvORR071]|uniref:endo-1,4-beta-xylanase n=1 Tax=Haloferula sp. BvORR071 TaxID=1396141 RepID=UPI00055263D0|nr:endo-1,4-beta-xylanase [Haloferula sp. BvORR071]